MIELASSEDWNDSLTYLEDGPTRHLIWRGYVTGVGLMTVGRGVGELADPSRGRAPTTAIPTLTSSFRLKAEARW